MERPGESRTPAHMTFRSSSPLAGSPGWAGCSHARGNFFETRDDVLVMRSDAELLRQSVRDSDAFAELYRRHRASVARYVARRLGADSFEDAAAEVFIRAFRGRAMYVAERDSALPWLLGIGTTYFSWPRSKPNCRPSNVASANSPSSPAPAAASDPRRTTSASTHSPARVVPVAFQVAEAVDRFSARQSRRLSLSSGQIWTGGRLDLWCMHNGWAPRPARAGRVGVIRAPVAKAVTPGPAPVAKTAVVAAAVTPGRHRRRI